MLIYIEGNIGSGKSTLIKLIRRDFNLGVYFVDEPVKEWLSLTDRKGKNILEHFYNDISKYGFMFQINASITKIEKIKETQSEPYYSKDLNIIFAERSIFSDRYCFAENLYDKDNMEDIEWQLYKNYFDWIKKNFPDVIPDGYIYIKTEPNICHKRIQKRDRKEETGVSLEYLTELHEKHNKWLESTDIPVCIIDGSVDFEQDHRQYLKIQEQLNNFIINIRKNL